MIEDDVVSALEAALPGVTGVNAVFDRELAMTDPEGSAGITLDLWRGGAVEMTPDGSRQPTIATYHFHIQHATSHVDQQEGNRLARRIAKDIRVLLYTNAAFLVSLRAIREGASPRVERFHSQDVTEQRYNSATINSSFVTMSVTDFTVQTETVTG